MKISNKVVFAIVLLFIINGFAQVDKKENDWGKENLKGKVKSFTCHTYKVIKKGRKIKKGERGDGCSDNFHLIFNNHGNKIEMNKYKSDKGLKAKYTYRYNKNGDIIETNTYKADGSLAKKYIYNYKYDKEGNWINKIEFKNNIPQKIRERTFEFFD